MALDEDARPDMAGFDAAVLKTFTDPGYLAIMAKAEELFVEASAEDTIIYMM